MADINKIKQYIDLADTLSFDIFGTLLLRLVSRKDDVFAMIERKTGIAGFAEERTHMGLKCAENAKHNSGTYTLDDVYSLIEQASGLKIGEYTWDRLKAIEAETESELLTRCETMYSLLKYAKRLGKNVIGISETYLHEDDVWKILEQHGIDGIDRLYLSSMTGKTKTDSELYEYAAVCIMT